MLYCPKKTNLFKAKSAKMLYCPKKPKKKKPKFGDLGLPPGPGGLQTLVFLVFLGQYGIFACFCLKRLFVLGQYSVVALPGLKHWYSRALSCSLPSEVSKS